MVDNAKRASDFLKALAHESRLMILCISRRRREIGQRTRRPAQLATTDGIAAARAPPRRWPGVDAPRRQGDLLQAGERRSAHRHRRNLRRVLPEGAQTLAAAASIRRRQKFAGSSASSNKPTSQSIHTRRNRAAPSPSEIVRSPIKSNCCVSAPANRIGFDRKSGLPETADRARHVLRRGHEQPALARLWFHEFFREDRIFRGIAGTRFQHHALARDAEAVEQWDRRNPLPALGCRADLHRRRNRRCARSDRRVRALPWRAMRVRSPLNDRFAVRRAKAWARLRLPARRCRRARRALHPTAESGFRARG